MISYIYKLPLGMLRQSLPCIHTTSTRYSGWAKESATPLFMQRLAPSELLPTHCISHCSFLFFFFLSLYAFPPEGSLRL